MRICSQTAEVECRLRSLQEDYAALQETQDRLEAEGKARVTELESQLTEMAGREKRWEEKAGQERESLEEEWAEKVRVLERSLEQSEACLQERKKTIQVTYTECFMVESAAQPLYMCMCTCRTRKFKYLQLMSRPNTQHALHSPLQPIRRSLAVRLMEVGPQRVTM